MTIELPVNHRYRLKGPLLLLAASSMGVLLLGEGALRILMPQPLGWDTARVWEPVDGLGWRRRAHLDVRVDTGEREVRVLSDADGHRVAAEPSAPPRFRVLAVGDSMLEALQVEAEQTVTVRLARSLSEGLGAPVEVVNAGVGGWNPNHYRIAVRQELGRAAHDLVLIFFYMENDLVRQRVEAFPPTTRFTPPSLRSLGGLTAAASSLLHRTSHLYVFLRNSREMLRMRAGERRAHLLESVLRSEASSPAWELTADLVAEASAAGSERGAAALCVLLPPHHYVDPEALATYTRAFGLAAPDVDVSQPARRLGQALARRGVAVVDVTPALRAAFAAGERELYGRVDRHFAPAGHEVVARALLPVVLERLEGRR